MLQRVFSRCGCIPEFAKSENAKGAKVLREGPKGSGCFARNDYTCGENASGDCLRGSRFLKDEEGSTLIEFAFCIPVFLLILFGAFYMFMALFFYCNASYASRMAVRYASLHSSTSMAPATSSSVQNAIQPILWLNPAFTTTVATTWQPSNAVGSMVQVTISMILPITIPFTSVTQIPVSSTAQRVIVY